MESKNKQFIPEMLFSAAEGYYQLGKSAATMIGQDDNLIQRMVPAMTNFSFAIELLLKGLLNSTNGIKQKGHSFVKLFNNLSALDRTTIEQTFISFKDSIPEKDRLPAFIFSITNRDAPKEAHDNNEDLLTFLKLHDLSFEVWRYFFEYQDVKTLYANFHLLECFTKSLISVINIKGYKPTVVTNMPKIW